LTDHINKDFASLTKSPFQPGNEKDLNVESIKEEMAHHLQSMRERKLVASPSDPHPPDEVLDIMRRVNMHSNSGKTANLTDLEMMVNMLNLVTGYIPVPYLENGKQIRKSNQLVHLQHDRAMDLEAQASVDHSVNQRDNMHRWHSDHRTAKQAQVCCANDGSKQVQLDMVQLTRLASEYQQQWVIHCPHPEESGQHTTPRHISGHHPHQVPGRGTVQYQGVVADDGNGCTIQNYT
jgi:hypothetical protein